MSIANLIKKIFSDETTEQKDNDEEFWASLQEKEKLKQEMLIQEKEDKARMHVWTEAYLVYLKNHLPKQARILADDATDIYMQKYNGEI